jgi:hypothetical protein
MFLAHFSKKRADCIIEPLLPGIKLLKMDPSAFITIQVGTSLNLGDKHPDYGTVDKLLDARYEEVLRQYLEADPSLSRDRFIKKKIDNAPISFDASITTSNL